MYQVELCLIVGVDGDGCNGGAECDECGQRQLTNERTLIKMIHLPFVPVLGLGIDTGEDEVNLATYFIVDDVTWEIGLNRFTCDLMPLVAKNDESQTKILAALQEHGWDLVPDDEEGEDDSDEE